MSNDMDRAASGGGASSPVSVRHWGNTNEAHMRVETFDPEATQTRYQRELHICPALPNGVHVSVGIWGIGHDGQHHAGLRLTPAEAIELVAHITRILAHGDWVATDQSPATGGSL